MNQPNKVFQGNPCWRGHVGRRYLCNGACVDCTAMNGKKGREKREQQAATTAPASPEVTG